VIFFAFHTNYKPLLKKQAAITIKNTDYQYNKFYLNLNL